MALCRFAINKVAILLQHSGAEIFNCALAGRSNFYQPAVLEFA
jgi:hypothetical protein